MLSKTMPNAPKGFACCRSLSDRVQTSHLVVFIPNRGTPGPTLCSMSRFDQLDPETYAVVQQADLPGWSINGGTSGSDIDQVKYAECWQIANDSISEATAKQ